jgi:hypothetical protein
MKSFFLVLLLCGTASARVVMTPTIPRSCPRGASWDQVEKCLARFGKAKVLRDVGSAKLVLLGDGGSSGWRVPGFYVYVRDDKAWRFGGMYDTSADDFDLASFQQVKIANHIGYRFDIAESARNEIPVSEEQTRLGLVLSKTSVFCGTNQIRCAAIITACDVFIDGQSRETYRGKLSFHGDIVQNVGDRRHATQSCAVAEELQLFWGD